MQHDNNSGTKFLILLNHKNKPHLTPKGDPAKIVGQKMLEKIYQNWVFEMSPQGYRISVPDVTVMWKFFIKTTAHCALDDFNPCIWQDP